MTTKYTPGKWKIGKAYSCGDLPIWSENATKQTGVGELLACVTVGQLSSDEQWANARLIALAPEMVEVLRELGELMERIGRTAQTPPCMSIEERDHARESYRAILAKVEGE